MALALRPAEVAGQQAPLDTHAINQLNATAFEMYASQPGRTLQFAIAALSGSETLHYPKGRAEALHNMALISLVLGRPDTALTYLDRSLVSATEAGDPLVLARIFNTRGIIRYHEVSPDSALRDLVQALRWSRETRNPLQVSAALTQLGTTHKRMGHGREAVEAFSESWRLDSSRRDTVRMANGLVNLGGAHAANKNLPSANYYLKKAETLAPFVDDATVKGNIYLSLGDVLRESDYWDEALTRYELARTMFVKVNDKRGTGRALGRLGETWELKGDTTRAIDFLVQSVNLQKEGGDREAVTLLAGRLGRMMMLRRQWDKALNLLRDAVNAGAGTTLRKDHLQNLMALSTVYEKVDRPGDALRIYRWAVSLEDSLQRETLAEKDAQLQTRFDEMRNRYVALDSLHKKQKVALDNATSLGPVWQLITWVSLGAVSLLLLIATIAMAVSRRRARRREAQAQAQLGRREEVVAALLLRLDPPAPESLLRFGLAAALQEQAAGMRSNSGIEMIVTEVEEVPRMLPEWELKLFHLFSHLLAVMRTEEQARAVNLSFDRKDNQLLVTCVAQGRGLHDEAYLRTQPPPEWMLLLTRLAQVRAQWEADAAPGTGLTVKIRVPIRR